jgi:HlyD family secretion protein
VQNVVTYDAVLDVDNGQLKLKPGMTANCTFVYAQRDDALRVANAALRFVPPPELLARLHPGGRTGRGARRQGGGGRRRDSGTRAPDRRVVWVLRNGQPHPVPIKIGISDGSLTEVVSGDLKAGDVVLTGATVGGGAPATAAPTRGQGAAGGNFPRRLM